MLDYDGINEEYRASIDRAERDLLAALLAAMKDGEVTTVRRIPFVWEICDSCGGSGGHSRHLGAFTTDEIAEWSDEFEEGYLSGSFDKTCEACAGTGKVRVIDEEVLPVDVREWIEGYRDDAYWDAAAIKSERLAGC